MNIKKNISRDDIAYSINKEFGFAKQECLSLVNDIIDIIIEGLMSNGIVKIHNFGTFKVKRKKSRIGRNPKTKQEVLINDRNVIVFKASKIILKYLNKNKINEKIS